MNALRMSPLLLLLAVVAAAQAPEPPWIASVVPAAVQPHASDPALIWYDDFDAPKDQYGEAQGGLDDREAFGGAGSSLELRYDKGAQGFGNRKIFFGDAPAYGSKVVRKGETFDEVYWRIYVKHPFGWTGSPAKMSRATSLASGNWTQAMISHVWSSKNASLTLDPASGVSGDTVVTRRYNDFERLRWLGNRPASSYPIHATSEAGYWVLVEARAKLNTADQKDGINQLWIDGRLECERRNLDWRGSYTGHGINAVFLEAYWNNGSPVAQSRWFDNFVVSTAPIGPVVCPANPELIKTDYRGPGADGGWELEVAADYDGADIVYRSKHLSGTRTTIDTAHGTFIGSLTSASALAPGRTYYTRARQRSDAGAWSQWSRWHQGFRVE